MSQFAASAFAVPPVKQPPVLGVVPLVSCAQARAAEKAFSKVYLCSSRPVRFSTSLVKAFFFTYGRQAISDDQFRSPRYKGSPGFSGTARV